MKQNSKKNFGWLHWIPCLCFLALLYACSSDKNQLEKYSKMTDDDKAKQALDTKDYDAAIAYYTDLVAADPEGYWRYPLLSASYSGKAGIDVLSIVKNQLSSASGKSINLLADMGELLPKDTAGDTTTLLKSAKSVLESMPAEQRSTNGTYAYSVGASSQLNLIEGMLAVSIVNKYTTLDTAGTVDRTKLEQMPDAEVAEFLDVLTTMSQDDSNSTLGSTMKKSAADTLEKVNAMEGATDKERLMNYIASTKGTPQTPT